MRERSKIVNYKELLEPYRDKEIKIRGTYTEKGYSSCNAFVYRFLMEDVRVVEGEKEQVVADRLWIELPCSVILGTAMDIGDGLEFNAKVLEVLKYVDRHNVEVYNMELEYKSDLVVIDDNGRNEINFNDDESLTINNEAINYRVQGTIDYDKKAVRWLNLNRKSEENDDTEDKDIKPE